MTDKQRILSEIERKYNEWKLGNSAEAKYRCEAYKELMEFIKPMQEEPVSKDLEKTSYDFACRYHPLKTEYSASSPNPEIIKAFKAGAKWQYAQFEKNRLIACDKQTKEEAKIEMDFVTSIIEKEHRLPTYDDAIKYGMKLKKQQMIDSAIDATIGYWNHSGLSIDVKLPKGLKEGSKCKLIIIKDK